MKNFAERVKERIAFERADLLHFACHKMYRTFFFSSINDLLLKLPITFEELCGLYAIKCGEVL
jgi:hypothetical protein